MPDSPNTTRKDSLHMPSPDTTISHDQLRACGYSGMVGLRDDVTFRLLCAFNGIDPSKAPPAWWAYPNSASKAAWERVAAEAAAIFGGAP